MIYPFINYFIIYGKIDFIVLYYILNIIEKKMNGIVKVINNIRKISKVPFPCQEYYLSLSGKNAQPLVANGIDFCGISNLCKGYQIGYADPPKRHMVIFTKSGEGYLKTPTQNYHLHEGTVISIPPGTTSMFEVCEKKWDILWFYMLDIPLWESLKSQNIVFKKVSIIPILEEVMKGYLFETKLESVENKAAILFAELMIVYLESSFDVNPEKDIDEMKIRMKKIWQMIQENPEKKWTKQEMAGELHVSVSTFDRLVKKHYGVTPWQKVIQIRMEQAKMFLRRTDYPLKLIADRLGYANEFIFSNAFKKHTSESPKTFRLRINKLGKI